MNASASPPTLDETAWLAFATRHHPAMVRVAEAFLGDPAAAERLTLGVWREVSAADLLRGSATDAGRTLVRAVIARARAASGAELEETAAPPPFPSARFLGDDHERWPGHWADPPAPVDPGAWEGDVGRGVAADAFAALSTSERVVLALRDVAGWTTQEIGDALEADVATCRQLLANARWSIARRLDAAIRGAEQASA